MTLFAHYGVLRNSSQFTYREDGGQSLDSTSAQGNVWDLFWRDPSFSKDAIGVEPNL